MDRLLLPFAALICIPFPAAAQVVTGIASVIDGDTLDMTGVTVRLHGMDAPELAQTCNRDGEAWKCGVEAADVLRQFVDGREVECEQQRLDADGRMVALCKAGSVDLNRNMVVAGLAVALTEATDEFVEVEQNARLHKVGIWASEFQAPADFRAANPQLFRVARARSAPVARSPRPATVFYRGCHEVRAAGRAPLYRGQPGYRPDMDGDSDGIACEPVR